ncbi:cysteine synthase family protein [Sporosarcina limicola]|uniref:Cysteine synthase A n=1 Tax=Sporosarcina limicola TaxID=34101 RepID=A0A927MMR3_9BACL|nr:cysteine synthase family protein [Sporosarcina limicola]MBE1556813.1 cysteine synthase A [Sporosarcina limicola]
MIDAIGNTPLIKLKLNKSAKCEVFAKLELLNPYGMKDRVAKRTIMDAKQKGILLPDDLIIESSSGTMACGVALVGRGLGHDVHIVTDPRIDDVTKAKLISLGCKLHIVDKIGNGGWQGVRLVKLKSLLKQYPNAFWPMQYENPENPMSYAELAQEVLNVIDKVDILVASVGSGGSISGIARELKKKNSKLKVIAVDAVGSMIFGQPDIPERLQGGLGNSLVAKNVDYSIIDKVHWLNDEEAFEATLQLAREQQIFAGNSSGSVYAVARWLSSQEDVGKKILAIFPDRGDRYVNTIFNNEYRKEKGLLNVNLPTSPLFVPYETIVSSWSYSELRGVENT